MTVKQLIKMLQDIEAEGKGNWKVGVMEQKYLVNDVATFVGEPNYVQLELE